MDVSIHAPVWGATWEDRSGSGTRSGFNPRSRMGSDNAAIRFFLAGLCFNPRSRMGSDKIPDPPASGHPVSIHAPVWGATRRTAKHRDGRKGFNPRSRMGSDNFSPAEYPQAWEFQSTLPYGERPNPRDSAGLSTWCFNPRSRMGSDAIWLCRPYHHPVSIHAPVWGATYSDTEWNNFINVSIHAPVWGATFSEMMCRRFYKFQSTLPYGERHIKTRLLGCSWKFQSTLPYGERHLIMPFYNYGESFNPRSRMGSDCCL